MPVEDFYDFYDEEFHRLVIFDEFKGQKSLCFLNRWLQGDLFCIRRKGSQAIKTRNLPFIFCSNFSPTQCYKISDTSLDAFLVRIQPIEIVSPLDLDNIQWNSSDFSVQSSINEKDEEIQQ